MSEGASGKPEQAAKKNPAVARVLSSDQVVLNIGSKDGVQRGIRYLIYEMSDDEVTDPTTGESLGQVEIPKGTGRIVNVQQNMAVLESDRELSGGFDEPLTIGAAELMRPGRKAPFRSPWPGDRVKRLF